MSELASVGEARVRAARVLSRVWVDRAFSAAALDTELSRPIDPRDAGLATELVYGVLRTQGFLENELSQLARNGRLFDAPEALAHLLMGVYSIAFLDRVPVFAAVSDAVAGVTAAIGPKPGGFANAILRAYATKLEAQARPTLEQAALESAPGWLRGALRRSLGRKGAERFLAAGPIPPPLGIAVGDRRARDEWLAKFRELLPEASFEPSALSAHGIIARGAGAPQRLPGFEQAWIVQEEGAQLVTLACGAAEGSAVLDACAGRGNKAWLLSHLVGEHGWVTAVDKYPEKIDRWQKRAPFPERTSSAAVDWAVGTGGLPRDRDIALVDAPCSGVGTLRRRPEIALFRTPDDVLSLTQEQLMITRSAARLVKPGGQLIYAVCSVLREECEAVVEALTAESQGIRLTPEPFREPWIGALTGSTEPTSFRLLPHEHATDGYFVARFSVTPA